MLRRARRDDLPGIGALSINWLGWTQVASTASVVEWRGESDVLSLNYFPLVPDIARPVGDDVALRDQFRREAVGGFALVDAGWVRGPGGRPVAQVALKLAQAEAGMTYVGSLVVPFARCSWVVKLQCSEVGPTGMREALWFNQHLASGGSLDDVGFGAPLAAREPGGRSVVRRVPADDPHWDGLVPLHPLSRLRRTLPALLASVRLDRDAERLAPFA